MSHVDWVMLHMDEWWMSHVDSVMQHMDKSCQVYILHVIYQ